MLARRLRSLFPHDPHAGPDGSYQVTSLYFDTPYDDALREKIDGAGRREKFRLRYYGTEPTFLKLEKKFKINGLCGKRSAQLTLGQAERLLAGEHGFLLESGDPLLTELYSKLRGRCLGPRTVVRYDREAFLYAPKRPGHSGPEGADRAELQGLPYPPGGRSGRDGRVHGAGGQIRRLPAQPGAHGRPGPGAAGGRLLQIRPVPAV